MLAEKNKALDLVDSFYIEMYDFKVSDEVLIHKSKEFALKCVRECIDCTRGRFGDDLSMQYWLDVEKEINKL